MAAIVKGLARPPRVVPAVVFDARREAERVVAEARAEAERVRGQAAREGAHVREAARAAGRDEALAEVSQLLTSAAAERDRLLASAEPELVRLALGIAARVLRREAELSCDVAVEMARRALEEVRERSCVSVRAHPEDLAALRAAGLASLVPAANGIAWVADHAVGRGGVVVETETGSIDARLDSQLLFAASAVAGAEP